jgi:hypothetical protein
MIECKFPLAELEEQRYAVAPDKAMHIFTIKLKQVVMVGDGSSNQQPHPNVKKKVV